MDHVIAATVEILLAATGRFAVWLFSFGRWRSERLTSDEGRVHGAAGALSFIHDGWRVVTHTGQLFAGVAFYILLIALGVAYGVAV